MNRTHDHDALETMWEQSFGYPPYPSQVDLFSTLQKHTNSSQPLILEAPTGSGKSNIGLFMGMLIPKNGRVDYICSTTNLQRQLYQDSQKIDIYKGKTAVLYGKARYFNTDLLKDYLLALDIEELGFTANVITCIKDCLNLLYNMAQHPDEEFWTRPMKSIAEDIFRERGINAEFEKVWTRINSSACTSKEKQKACLQRQARKKLKTASLGIINSSIVMMYAAHSNLDKLFDSTKLCIFDEAHTLSKQGEELFKNFLPPTMSFNATSDLLRDHNKNNVCIVSGKMDKVNHSEYGTPNDILFQRKEICSSINLQPDYSSRDWLLLKTIIDSLYRAYAYVCNTFQVKLSEIPDDDDDFYDDENHEEDVESNSSMSLYETLASLNETNFHVRTKSEDEKSNYAISTIKRSTDIIDDAVKESLPIDATKILVIKNVDKKFEIIVKSMCDTELTQALLGIATKLTSYDKTKNIGALKKEILKIYKFVKSVELLNTAKKQDSWIDSEYRLIIPNLTIKDDDKIIQYEATEQLRMELFQKYVWNPIYELVQVKPLLMSATITNKTLKDPFDIFKKEIGLFEVNTKIAKPVFDSRRITVYYPYLKMWRYTLTPEEKDTHLKTRFQCLSPLISMNPRGSLVVGTHQELRDLMPLLRQAFPTYQILLYSEDEKKVDELKYASDVRWSNIVILGTEKMYIGLNLPGCIGLVAILRSLNEPPKKVEIKYSELLQEFDKVKYDERVEHIRLTKQMQAIGRLMRKETDFGVIAFLSHLQKDVDYVKHYYANAKFVRNFNKWPVC